MRSVSCRCIIFTSVSDKPEKQVPQHSCNAGRAYETPTLIHIPASVRVLSGMWLESQVASMATQLVEKRGCEYLLAFNHGDVLLMERCKVAGGDLPAEGLWTGEGLCRPPEQKHALLIQITNVCHSRGSSSCQEDVVPALVLVHVCRCAEAAWCWAALRTAHTRTTDWFSLLYSPQWPSHDRAALPLVRYGL